MGFLLGENWVYGAHSTGVFYLVLGGHPSAADMHALVRVMTRELARQPHRTLVDVSQLSVIFPETFQILVRYFAEHRDALSKAVTEVAVVLPRGMARATVAGFFSVAPQPFPVGLHTSLREAAAAFCSSHAESFGATVTHALQLQREGRSVLSRASEQLRSASPSPTCSEVARSLGMSERSLQRHLRLAGATYSQLQRAARLGSAKERLATSQQSVTEIAADFGFSSSQHFTTLFKRAFGVTPSQFRQKKGG